MQFHRLPGFPNLGTPQGGSFLGRQISPNLEKATRKTAVHHPGPTNLSQISCNSLLPMITSQPCYPGGDINMVKIIALQPWTPLLNLGDVAPESVFQLQGHLLPHFPNSPKPKPIIVIVVSPNLPGHLPALFRELEQLRQRLLSSPAIQNLGSFPLTLLYSKSSRLPSSHVQVGTTARWRAAPSTSRSHNLRRSPPEI